MSTSIRSHVKREKLEGEALAVEHRPLTVPEALDVCARISREPAITGYSVKEWTRTRDVLVCSDTAAGQVCGVALIHHVFPRWSEIAVVLVFDEYRGRGLSHRLVCEAVEHIDRRGRRAILFFSDEVLGRRARASGLVIHGSEDEFANGSLTRSLFIRLLYPLQWRSDKFRRQEIRRKTTLSGAPFTFKIAAHERAK